jgi:hypothetical protein
MVTPPAPTASSFQHSIKTNISYYPKLKDETQWPAYNCQLRSTAASHKTIDVLNSQYVPPIHSLASFQDKQRFMYNVFTNIIHITKNKNYVREKSLSLGAKKVYTCLLDVYQ